MDPVLLILPPATAHRLREALVDWPVEEAHSLDRGLARAVGRAWTAVVLSLEMAGLDGEMASRLARRPEVGALILTHKAPDLELTLLAERCGAAALVPHPPDPELLRREVGRMAGEGGSVPLPDPETSLDGEEHRMVGNSPALAEVFRTVARVASTSATVLVQGESGTGKELVARALHAASLRAERPFIAVNCAALPEHLLEAELFGHEKGSFTGAVARSEGRFGRADGGTLFLDEIGDMSLVLQAKILRALEEREIERVGGREAIPVDVRVVAATNRPLRELVEAGDFRADLYYRLAVVEVVLPPLRERPGDLEMLALHFASRFARRYGRPVRRLGLRALERIREYPWPGNVRELRNVMDRAVLLARGGMVTAADLGLEAPRALHTAPPPGRPDGDHDDARVPPPDAVQVPPPGAPLREVEAWHIARALAASGGHMGEAAARLGIHRNTLTAKVREYGLSRSEGR